MVSIIIPSYNNLASLKKCLLSIQNQSYKNFEVWIIDNHSTDGTQEFLTALKAPFNWVSEQDNGIYDAMNKGVSLATKDWLYFLGSDDVFYDINVLSDIFSKSIASEIQMIIGSIKYDLQVGDNLYTHTKDGLVKPSWSNKLWIKNSVHHQGAFYNKKVFSELNYDIKYTILADYALNLLLFNKKINVKRVDLIVALCGTKGISKKYSKELYNQEVLLKVDRSSKLLWPLFKIISICKYYVKKIKN